jgi:hypothetical protein
VTDNKREPTLEELLERARHHVITPEDAEAQRQSWVRGEMALSKAEEGMTTVFRPPVESAEKAREWPKCGEFTKLPVTIYAFRYDGPQDAFNLGSWAGRGVFGWDSQNVLHVKTLEGEHIASVGDYIIRGVKDEFYPCKPDIFKSTYSFATQQQPDASKLAEKDWFLCAKWTRLQDGCVARCDQPSKHEGRHLDSVIAISWRGEGWHSRNPSLCDSLDKPVEVNSDPA